MGFIPPTLDVALRAYVPAVEEIGRPLPEQLTVTNIGAAREATGLTWEPFTEPQFRSRRLGPGMESFEEVPGFKYVTRGEGGAILGNTKASYHLFRNAELFAVAEAVGIAALDQRRTVRFVAGGELNGGRRVFLLAELDQPREIPGDPSPHVRYLTLLSSHDGSGAVKVLGTDMRWSCTNALRAAEMQAAASAAAFSFRHTSKIQKRLADAHKAIVAAVLQHDAIDERTRVMLERRVSPAQASDYLAQFALARVISKANPQRRAQADASPQRDFALRALEGDLRRIYAGPTCEGIRDTAYGPFAAVVEYLDNGRPAVSADSRFERSMVNTETGKSLAFRLTRDLL